MTNKTNRSRKKNTGEKVLLIGLLLVVAVLLCMVIYQHFRKGKDAPPSGGRGASVLY